MPKAFSIWFVPEAGTREYERLDEQITEYARSYPDAPDFEPHVTVLGSVGTDQEVLRERTRELADGVDPFELAFTTVSCSTTTHQCVFLLVEASVPVLTLHQRAAAAFGTDPGMYVPHLSLVYSDMPLEDRVRAVHSLDTESLPSTVGIDSIAIVETSGTVPEWRTTAEFQL